MSITVHPTLTVGGVAIATAATADLFAVDDLSLSWGRASVLEQPTPATVRLTLLDRSPAATFAARTDLIGQPVVIGWAADGLSGPGTSGTTFRGRITDVDVLPLPGAVAGSGFRVGLAASSREVELANWVLPENTVWPAETFTQRRLRLQGMFPSGYFTGGVVTPGRHDMGLPASSEPTDDPGNYTAALVDVSGRSALDLLRELFLSMSPLPMVYNPTLDALIYPSRTRYAARTYESDGTYAPTVSAQLVPSADRGGRYVAASLTGRHLDAHLLAYAAPLRQQLDSRLTRVELGYLDAAATPAYDQRTATASTASTPDEPTIGRRVLSVSTIHADATKAAQLAGIYADLVNREARTPRLAQVGYSTTREPIADVGHAGLLLSGAETGQAVFLGRSWLPQLGQRPLVGILGAAITYAGGDWSVDFTPSPVIVDPAPNVWGPVTVAASSVAGVRLADIDPSVTVGDMAFIDVGAGYDATSQPPYRGNPYP